jgi:hypothetical protein
MVQPGHVILKPATESSVTRNLPQEVHLKRRRVWIELGQVIFFNSQVAIPRIPLKCLRFPLLGSQSGPSLPAFGKTF